MTRRSGAHLDVRMQRLGTDLELFFPGPAGWWEDADLTATVGSTRRALDLKLTSGVPAADQMLINRLKTHKGELASLGHPEYGSRHHELIGEPNVERTRNLVKRHVLEALSHEPRVESVLRIEVTAPDPVRDMVRIVMDVKLIEEDEVRNLVVPFSLEVAT